MRQVYIKEIIHKATSTDDDYIYDDVVDSGKILIVKHISLIWSDIGTSQDTLFFIEDSGRKIYISDDSPESNSGVTFSNIDIPIGESDRIGAYNSGITTDDIVHLYIFGELWDRDDWIFSHPS